MTNKIEDPRPSWDHYFMEICETVSTRATCNRKHVGSIIVRDRRIVAEGYNGSLPTQPHCDDPDTFWECRNCGEKREKGSETVEICNNPDNLSCLNKHMVLRHGNHDMFENHCVRTVHAEVNAIAQAARLGISTEGTTLYCNTLPCWNCFKTIVSAGIKEVVYRDEYPSASADRVKKVSQELPEFILRRVMNRS